RLYRVSVAGGNRDDAVAVQQRARCERELSTDGVGAAGPVAAAVDVDLDANLIRDAVAQLSDRRRAMIYRSHYLGRTTSQIAAELRTNDDVVKHELHHALHTLRMALDRAGERPRR
ncbi:MAG: sigma factor-like helix-turn-helix DNA-binding protein, partial [Mycobacterium sp.]